MNTEETLCTFEESDLIVMARLVDVLLEDKRSVNIAVVLRRLLDLDLIGEPVTQSNVTLAAKEVGALWDLPSHDNDVYDLELGWARLIPKIVKTPVTVYIQKTPTGAVFDLQLVTRMAEAAFLEETDAPAEDASPNTVLPRFTFSPFTILNVWMSELNIGGDLTFQRVDKGVLYSMLNCVRNLYMKAGRTNPPMKDIFLAWRGMPEIASFLTGDSSDLPSLRIVDGDRYWYRDGKRHREDGPAVERANGDREWYRDGERHREDGPAVEGANGDRYWYRNGERHREDGPAVEVANGDRHWCRNGQLHREDGPAIEDANGDRYWYRNGQLHREDGPAVEFVNGDRHWYRKGECHREGGPAIERANGNRFWYRNDQLHREDGPAIEYVDGDRHWYRDDQRHREDGPAIEKANGDRLWYRNGKRCDPPSEYPNGDT